MLENSVGHEGTSWHVLRKQTGSCYPSEMATGQRNPTRCALFLQHILGRISSPAHVAGYVCDLAIARGTPASKPAKKLPLAAKRQFFDRLVLRHAVILHPATSVEGPKPQVAERKTPAITPEQARRVLHSIDVSHVVGLRDRAIIGVLIYTAARGGAVADARLRVFYSDGRQWVFRFAEKGWNGPPQQRGIRRRLTKNHDPRTRRVLMPPGRAVQPLAESSFLWPSAS